MKGMHAPRAFCSFWCRLQAASQRLGCLNGAQVPGVAGRSSASSCAHALGFLTHMASAGVALVMLPCAHHVRIWLLEWDVV